MFSINRRECHVTRKALRIRYLTGDYILTGNKIMGVILSVL